MLETFPYIINQEHEGIVQFFNEQCRNLPYAPALQYKEKILNYSELNAASNRVANFLTGVLKKKHQIIGLCLDRSPELAIGVLGVLKAGAAYMPLDPEYPDDRISYMLRSAKCDIIITHGKFSSLFSDSGCKIITWEKEEEKINMQSSESLQLEINKDDLLYVLFTSGSTGAPKGVMMRHEPLINFLQWQKKENILSEPVNTLQYCPISFDVSLQEILTCWSTGGCLFMIDDDLRFNQLALLKFIEEYKIGRLFMVYSALHHLCKVAVENKIFPSSLKDIITGGEQVQITPAIISFFENCRDCKLHNHYGPTETNVVTTFTFSGPPSQWDTLPPIGKPVSNDFVYILDENLKPVGVGEEGELYVGGVGLAKGYLNSEELTNERFIRDPFSDDESARMYKTGDFVKELIDGNLQYTGRKDTQVKIRGYRVELVEIELAISSHKDVRQAVVIVREDVPGQQKLVAYIVPVKHAEIKISDIRKMLMEKIPEFMIPSAFVLAEAFPLTASGKIDRKNLPAPRIKRPEISSSYIAPVSRIEKEISKSWTGLLLIDKAGVNDNFFELGGNSLLATQFVTDFIRETGIDIPVTKLYEYSTIKELCNYVLQKSSPLNSEKTQQRIMLASRGQNSNKTIEDSIAIIGMSGRFPGARNVDELWNNLVNGIESSGFFKHDELDPSIDEDIKNDPDYVAARGIIEDADKFDAAFFGMNPRVAEITDPQQRIFLELAWEALENAGYANESGRGITGVFAGAGYNSYYINNVLPCKEVINRMGSFQAILSNEKDYLATLVSYMLDLKGPAMSIHTACSTSLVAVIEAVKSLREFECDLALAGGIAITSPVKSGYLHSEGSLFSADGHTRPFSADATGTTFSDGAGIVVLKRYTDAKRDGDAIYAAIRGIGINNDGHDKASFAAPGVHGQTSVIAMAQNDAGIDPESISYIEAHGTATPIGDPIEIEALTSAFRMKTQEKQFCALGSVKSNFGHLTAASGVAGLIKTTLALKHKIIPASINYLKPNPAIDFEGSPFYVNSSTREWKVKNFPRRAGVSSFGFGGTNAHVILEEVSENTRSTNLQEEPQLLLLSAKTGEALNRAESNLISYLKKNQSREDISLPDVAYTLQTGRKSFTHKKVIVANNVNEAIKFLEADNPLKVFSKTTYIPNPKIVFVFPDQDAYKINLGLKLYESEKVFRDAVNDCCYILKPIIEEDFRLVLFSGEMNTDASGLLLKHTAYLQPALFVINYATAKLFMHKGVIPEILLGERSGALVAACLAGVINLKDALEMATLAGELNQHGKLSGEKLLLEVSKTIQFRNPQIPVISGIRAERLSDQDVLDSQTWVKELSKKSNFPACATTLWNENPDYVILLFGLPRATILDDLSESDNRKLLVTVFENDDTDNNDRTSALIALGQLWLNGVPVEWKKIESKVTRNKIDLPAYPFERKRYWIDPPVKKEEFHTQYHNSITPFAENEFNPGQIKMTYNSEVNQADQNMMYLLLMQQMQMQQQLMAMMMSENIENSNNGAANKTG